MNSSEFLEFLLNSYTRDHGTNSFCSCFITNATKLGLLEFFQVFVVNAYFFQLFCLHNSKIHNKIMCRNSNSTSISVFYQCAPIRWLPHFVHCFLTNENPSLVSRDVLNGSINKARLSVQWSKSNVKIKSSSQSKEV